MMSLPMPTCEVTGTPIRQPAAAMLRWRNGELLFFDHAADRFAQPFAAVGGRKDDVVQAARLAPQAELAALDPLRDVFAGAAAEGQLEVVDDARAVGGQVRNDARARSDRSGSATVPA